MLPVVWQKNNQNNEWFDLLRLNLEAEYFKSTNKRGVFAIWYAAPTGGKVIKIGSGNLGEELKSMRSNPQILEYSKIGPIKVSWVAVNGVLKDNQVEGAEAYLYDVYRPLLSERKSGIAPIAIKHISK